jgi:hypothetical protein
LPSCDPVGGSCRSHTLSETESSGRPRSGVGQGETSLLCGGNVALATPECQKEFRAPRELARWGLVCFHSRRAELVHFLSRAEWVLDTRTTPIAPTSSAVRTRNADSAVRQPLPSGEGTEVIHLRIRVIHRRNTLTDLSLLSPGSTYSQLTKC